jgi:dTMP kinase
MANKGLFISFEGGEGAGKSTLIHKIADWLRSEDREVIETHEPGGTALAGDIRKLLLEKPAVAPKTELLLFLAARAEHVHDVIIPALNEGKIVLCDRFQDSTVAYQGFARNLGVKETLELCEYASGGLEPSLTLYLDIPPQIGLERAKKATKREKTDRMEAEKLEFHEKVRKGFLSLAEMFPQRIRLIDATNSAEVVYQTAVQQIKTLL